MFWRVCVCLFTCVRVSVCVYACVRMFVCVYVFLMRSSMYVPVCVRSAGAYRVSEVPCVGTIPCPCDTQRCVV